jgi:hypothetical protein
MTTTDILTCKPYLLEDVLEMLGWDSNEKIRDFVQSGIKRSGSAVVQDWNELLSVVKVRGKGVPGDNVEVGVYDDNVNIHWIFAIRGSKLLVFVDRETVARATLKVGDRFYDPADYERFEQRAH